MTDEKFGAINKVEIPDDDMMGWIKMLHEGGFSTEEIDSMMVRLNKKYFDSRGEEIIEAELKKIKKEWEKKNGQGMSHDQEEYFRKGIVYRLRGEQ